MRKLIYVILMMFVLLVGCSKEDEEQVQVTEEEKEEIPETEEESSGNVYPLTGMKTNDSVDNRIISIMINNHSDARPQTGLSQADIVFEILAEGKITRFLALYQSDLPEVVGPVRSAREYYFELANGYDAIYVYHGAADFVNDMIVNEGVNFLNGSTYDNDGNLFKRESFRKAPHNSYLLMEAVYEVAEGKGYKTTENHEPLTFLSEDELTEIQGESAKHVEIVYSDNPMEIVEFEYDVETGKYSRFNDKEQTVELDTGELIQVDNVFIVETRHEVIDDAGRRAIDLESGGNAFLIQKGKIQEVEWANQNGRIVPVMDGRTLGLVPGQTWINVVPTTPGLQQSVSITN
ncbi:DUF3048 domain-containing protein [Oceanobacillus bengalensis]|uniref:DUF3048 domain-containing protein n=1 Tax=Oceanobacillus bengalensis TaxID=1435466 RepID=A0A494YUP8_9BACI|nr:DUF3048 domain-containing protein [Oceanobacillus bengalensis]RKQ13829.1 DUF3048 domain-containing protein [Oceanobacillus bengalensis]